MWQTSAPDLAALAAVLANPARAAMLLALLDGTAWTQGELARGAGVAPSTASEHIGQLVSAGLVEELRQGRHRYVRLASPAVAEAVESLSALTERVRPAAPTLRAQRADRALREARSCYAHLAGRLGVSLCDGLREAGYVAVDWTLADPGRAWLDELGVRLPHRADRPLVRPCLDWTERRHHLAGAAADALLTRMLELGWVRRSDHGRALILTTDGRRGLEHLTPGL